MSFLKKLIPVDKTLEAIGKIVDDIHTSEEEKLDKEIMVNKLQSVINEIEAQSPSLFKSGWRPFVGWVCAFALMFAYVLTPIVQWIGALCDIVIPAAEFPMDHILSLLTGMLGIAGLRTYEKYKGVTK